MILADLPREAILDPRWWRVSPPVRQRERPVRVKADPSALRGQWVDALRALTNSGSFELGYDDWVRVCFAIHEETCGSEEGLALAHEFSSRSAKYSAEFLDERVWPYVKAGGGITGGTIMSLASRLSGWSAPLDDSAFVAIGNGGSDGRAADGGSGVAGGGAARPGAAVPDGAGSGAGGGGAARGAADGARGGVASGAADVGVVDGAVAGRGGEGTEPVERRGVPAAKHLCTDQANAGRLARAYGNRLLVAAGKWHTWDGRRWKADDGEVYRFACGLSAMVKEESARTMRRAKEKQAEDGSAEHVKRALAVCKALDAWSLRSEMKGTIEAAIGLLRKMLTVDAAQLDADPWLLNCGNGVVDLRTGVLRGHEAGLLMTKIVDVDYWEGATCAEWEQALDEIYCGDASVVRFLQRWAGYCLTGHVREQVFVVHWGRGGNGKSVVLDVLAETMGGYAGVAPPGLMAGGSGQDRHPTEVATLMGKRMVTAHETGEGVVLREDFIKSATGGDVMTARFMREDFFDFKPTHKLQLLTNHKPTIKGQDRGIWRRVLLLPYVAVFGDEEEVASGLAVAVRDMGLIERLKSREALQGVLAWRVRGAMAWAVGGLLPPDAVLDASARYQSEQDRVLQFVGECCEVDPGGADGGLGWSEALTNGMGGLYPGYKEWCSESGIHGLGRGRFADELRRAFPRLRFSTGMGAGESGKRRSVMNVAGIRLLQE